MHISARHTAFGASLIAIAMSAVSMPAFAQDDAGIEASEIVVTARRKDERLQDVPLTVNAVSAEDLGKLNIKRFEDVTSAVPGLTLGKNVNGIGVTASVRGVNYEVNASGNNGTIEFYRNDAPTSGGALFQAMYDIGQIELLRGPQGTLRGRASPSGSMTITTHRVNLSELGGYVMATATDLGGINANAALNIPVINDVLAVRVAAIVDENEGSRVRSINNGMKPYSRTTGGRATVRFEPTGNLRFEYSYEKLLQKLAQFNQIESLIPGGITASQRFSVQDTPNYVRQQFDMHNWQTEWAFRGQKLVYVGSFLRQKLYSLDPGDKGNALGASYTQDFANGSGLNFALPIPSSPGYVVANMGNSTRTDARAYSHELRLQSEEPLFGKLDYVVGGFLGTLDSPTDMTITMPNFASAVSPADAGATSCMVTDAIGTCTPLTSVGVFTAPATGLYVIPYPVRSKTKERSLFGNLTLHIGDATEISGGARYINYEDTNFTNTVGYNAVIYSAGIKHRFSEDLMVYASTGSSWRAGIDVKGPRNNIALVAGQAEYGFRRLAPEKSKSYEIGIKSSLFNQRVRVNVAAYHQDYTNFVYRAPGLIGVQYYALDTGSISSFNFIAAVPVKVNGVEAEVNAQLTRNWSMALNASYSMGKIKNGFIPCNPGSPGLVASTVNGSGGLDASHTLAGCNVSQRAGNVAPFSANIQTEYFRSIGGQVDGYVRGLVNFTGQSQGDPQYTGDQVKAYALLNLFAGIRDPKGAWDIGVYAKNLTNLNMVLTRESLPHFASYMINSGAGGSGAAFSTNRGVTVTRPREFGLSVRYAFGSR